MTAPIGGELAQKPTTGFYRAVSVAESSSGSMTMPSWSSAAVCATTARTSRAIRPSLR